MNYKWFFNKYSQYEIIEQTDDWLYCRKKANHQVDYKNNFWEAYLSTNKAPYEMTAKIFMSCPFLNKIFKNYKVKNVILSGSGLYNIIDNISDYDISVFITDSTEQIINSDDECLFYKGRKLHWYYNDYNKLFEIPTETNLYKAELYYFTKEKVLFSDDKDLAKNINKNKYSWLINYIKNNYEYIKYIYNNFAEIINNFKHAGDIKMMAYFILFYLTISNKPLDEALIGKLKRSYYVELPKDDQDKVKKLLGDIIYTLSEV